jgi:FHA domain
MTLGRVGCVIVPGRAPEWTFVVGHAFLAAVPASTPQWIIASLTELVGRPAIEIESVVSLLPLAGDDEVESFVVAVPGEATDTDGIPVTAVVRGAAAADVFSVGGSRRFTDRDIRPWLLADFKSVTGMVLGSRQVTMVRADLLESGTPIGIGALPGNTLFWSTVAGSHPAVPHGAAPEPATGASAVPLDDTDDTVLRASRPAGFPDVDGDTVIRARPGVDDTVLTARRNGAAAVPAPVRPVPALPRYGFRVGGEDRRLDTVYYIGRRPSMPRSSGSRLPRLVTVRSSTSVVSGTHLEIRQEGDSVVVTDLGSTNGTTVTSPQGKKERMRRGASLAVVPGTKVDIGDGNIIEILPVSGH